MEFPGGGEHIEKWWWGVGGEGYRRPGTDSLTNLSREIFGTSWI